MKHHLTVVTIVRNEARYIREWISHHRKEGVDNFIIYDNESTDNLDDALSPFKYCTYVLNWPVFPGQKTAYADALKRFGNTTKWMAFIDADEFLWSPTTTVAVELEKFDYAAAVAVNWLLFGSNANSAYEDKPVVERFTRRADGVNPHVKSIVQPSLVKGIGVNVHTFDLDGPVVDEKHRHLDSDNYALHPGGSAERLAINHYHVKSYEEYKEKCQRGRADTGELRDFVTSFEAHDRNDVEDTRLLIKHCR